jgi:predicted RNA-binding protein YlxR (DUF448 family)
MTSSGHVPERTCRGCGLKGLQGELVRFVVADGRLKEDRWRTMRGRGVYCCDAAVCRGRLAKNRKVLQARCRAWLGE